MGTNERPEGIRHPRTTAGDVAANLAFRDTISLSFSRYGCFVQASHIAAPAAPWCSRASPAVGPNALARARVTLGVTRCLCKQALNSSPLGSSKRNLQSTKKAKTKILSAAIATQKYRGSPRSDSQGEMFSPNEGNFLPLTLPHQCGALHFKNVHWKNKKQEETNKKPSSVCFCKPKPHPNARRENMVSS